MAARKSTGSGGRVFVGVGGWSFAPWRGVFYPRGLAQARELAYMSSRLNSIEINSTFYRLQKPATFQRWHDETPEHFVFAVKAPMFIVGRRDLATAAASITRFLDSGISNLGNKLGPINWQLGPGKRFAATEIDAFLSLLPKTHDGMTLRHALEVRHSSFEVPGFVELARRHGAAIVLAGDSEYPQISDTTAPFSYLRIMGTVETQQYGYAPVALNRWTRRAKALAAGRRDVFLYVISGAKQRNPVAAQRLLEKLSR